MKIGNSVWEHWEDREGEIQKIVDHRYFLGYCPACHRKVCVPKDYGEKIVFHLKKWGIDGQIDNRSGWAKLIEKLLPQKILFELHHQVE